MSLSVSLAIAWVFASTITAFLPMRNQYAPGIILLIAAPILIIWLGVEHGFIPGLAAAAAFISMFRNPLRYFWKKWRGDEMEIPK